MSQRVRGDVEREERRRTLVESAEALLAEHSYNRVRIEDVARRAGVAKGTVFLYFANKEALILAVLRSRLARAIDRIEQELDAVGHAAGADSLVQSFLDAYYDDPLTARMMALWPAVLEDGAPAADVEAFQGFLQERGAGLAARICQVSPTIDADGAERLVRHLGVMVIGMAAIGGNPSPALDASVFPKVMAAVVGRAA